MAAITRNQCLTGRSASTVALNDIRRGFHDVHLFGTARRPLVLCNMPFGLAPTRKMLALTSDGGETGLTLQRAAFEAVARFRRTDAGRRARVSLLGYSVGNAADDRWEMVDLARSILGPQGLSGTILADEGLVRVDGKRILTNPSPLAEALHAAGGCALYHPDPVEIRQIYAELADSLIRQGMPDLSYLVSTSGPKHESAPRPTTRMHTVTNHANTLGAPQRDRLFYGWIIVGSVFFMSATAAGIIYSFPAFVASFEADFQTGRADISLIFAVSEFIWFMTGFAAGFVADRFGPRKVGLAGAVFMALGLAGASMAPSLPVLYLAYGAGVGIGGGMIYVPAVGLVQRWFKVKRGLASGLAVCGTGVGTLLLPPLAMALNEAMGWRGAHMVLAGCALVICGTASLLLVYHPRDMGLAPDGGPASPDVSRTAPLPGLSLAEAVAQARFWLLYMASLLSAAGVFINYVHLVPYATDNGVSAQRGIVLVGIMGICSTFGRFLLGGLADRFGRRTLLSYVFAGLSLTMFWWLLAPPVFLSLVLYAALFGILYGGYIALLPVLAMEYFGGHRIATIIGALYTSWGVGALFGPTMAGAIRDASGAYFYAILVGAISMAVSALCCRLIREPETPY